MALLRPENDPRNDVLLGHEPYTGPKIVVYAGTRNIYDKMARAAKSLIYHTDVDKVYFLIEDDKFDYKEELPKNFVCMNVSDQQFFPPFGANYNSRWTYMAYMKLGLHELLPQYDRVLWLDDDTYVISDISEIFDAPLKNEYYYALCEEVESYLQYTQLLRKQGKFLSRTTLNRIEWPYYNIGVALLNLKMLRDGMGDRLIDVLNEYEQGCPEQDIINEYCADHIYRIPSEYNAAYFTKTPKHMKIYHYSGLDNDELTLRLNQRYTDLTFDQIYSWRQARKEYLNNVRNS